MKNQRILAAVFVLVTMFSFSAMANLKGGGKSADAKFAYSLRAEQNTDKVVLSFDNFLKQNVTIKIYDAANTLVFKEVQYGTEALRKRYDLSELKDGTYTIKIESEKFTFKEDVVVGKNWNTSNFEAVIAPDPYSSDKLRIGFANAKSDVIVEIADAYGNVVHSEVFDNQFSSQLFNMKNLRPGEYTISVSSGSQTITETYIAE